jgi:TRAP transporter TAXI family solute receptor
MTMRVFLALLVLLAGCGRGPDADALKRDVEARLSQALPSGTVTVAEFVRRGSQADTRAPAGETRRVIYYDAYLRLERDFDFGAWDSPGMAGLISALGSGPKGVTGVAAGGNRAGDMVRARGTALYKREGNDWVSVAAAGHRPEAAPAYATSAPREGAAAILEAMRRTIDSVPKGASPAEMAVIEQELAVAHATIRARLARAAEGYAIAAGAEQGQYLRFARALAGLGGARFVPLVTPGGEENLRLLREGKVAAALAQGDAALDALRGTGSFEANGPHETLRAVGSLYPEPVHVLAHRRSGLSALEDLHGRRVAIGQQGSASRTTALRVLQAHGLRLEDIRPLELSLGDALTALRSGEADALIQVIGLPADSVRDALAEVPLVLLPLSERAIEALTGQKSGLFPFVVPAGAYPTQAKDVPTVATAALLLAGEHLSNAEVATLARTVFERGRDFAARGSAQGTQVSAANARQGLSVPLHPAAAEVLDALQGK